MSTEIATYSKYASLQTAAETFIAPKTASPGTTAFSDLDEAILEQGNSRSSKFTKVQAANGKINGPLTVIDGLSVTQAMNVLRDHSALGGSVFQISEEAFHA